MRTYVQPSITLLCTTALAVSMLDAGGADLREPRGIHVGSGAKAGEITHNGAIVHVRLTATPGQDEAGLIPGREGEARLKYAAARELTGARVTPWRAARAADDYSIQYRLDGLDPATRYYYRVECRTGDAGTAAVSDLFSFVTAPAPGTGGRVRFQVTTGQDVRGADTYLAMAAQKPDFLVSTGDNVYYDGAGKGRTVETAYQSYQRMYGLPQMKKYFMHVGGYFEKDDHDYRFNDSDPYMKGKWVKKNKLGADSKIGETRGDRFLDTHFLSHEEGIRVFKKVFPMSERTHRTFRWGRGVQIWLPEGRDFRSPNDMPDGPEKSIWGKEQREWLQSTLLESDADFRLIISPTPIIGPDRTTKRDNHANPRGFWTEGQAFLDWAREQGLDNLILLCGDRHWQYHSIDTRGIHEFSCGPTCDEHTQKVPPLYEGYRRPYSASRGGFLQVTYDPDRTLEFEFFSETGERLYRHSFSAPRR